ncbi:FG-GAP repeat-containing protein, partial [Maridesulfovibrio ferrireducens]
MHRLLILFTSVCFVFLPAMGWSATAGLDSLPTEAVSKIKIHMEDELCCFMAQPDGKITGHTLDGDLHLSTNAHGVSFDNGGNWFALSLDSIGREGSMKKVQSPVLFSKGRKLTLLRGSITEWYENHGGNIEHGLVIKESPAGEGDLMFAFATSGNLTPQQKGEDITFTGAETMNYSTIKAWDAKGRNLSCSMSVTGGRLFWQVNDSVAVYPLTVDPTVTFVKKLTASDAAADDSFGKSVSVSGDIALVG